MEVRQVRVKHHAVLECLMEVRQVRVMHHAVLECLLEVRQVRVMHHENRLCNTAWYSQIWKILLFYFRSRW